MTLPFAPSLIRSLRTARFARALRFAHTLARYFGAHGKESNVYELIASIVYHFNPLCALRLLFAANAYGGGFASASGASSQQKTQNIHRQKKMSAETNRRRKTIENKQKELEDKEEKRRQAVLAHRKQVLDRDF